jgi:hypothetical protein
MESGFVGLQSLSKECYLLKVFPKFICLTAVCLQNLNGSNLISTRETAE